MKIRIGNKTVNNLGMAQWTNGLRILLDGCSCPIQNWTIEQLKVRLSFQRGFWSRLAIVKQLLKRGFSCKEVEIIENDVIKTNVEKVKRSGRRVDVVVHIPCLTISGNLEKE